MLSLATLSSRLAALPIDPVPMRRAAILTVLLAVLLLATRMIAPARPRPATDAARQSVPASTETLSARPAPRSSGGGWGQAVALLLLAGGGAGAFLLHRRAAPRAARASTLEVLESHALAQGQGIRLVAVGDEVLLLGVGSEGVRVLRHWPRDRFDHPIADDDGQDALTDAPPATPPRSAALLLPTGEEAPPEAETEGVSSPTATPTGEQPPSTAETQGVPATAPVMPSPVMPSPVFSASRPAVPPQFAPAAAPVTTAPVTTAPPALAAPPADFAEVLRRFGVGHA